MEKSAAKMGEEVEEEDDDEDVDDDAVRALHLPRAAIAICTATHQPQIRRIIYSIHFHTVPSQLR